MHLTDTCKTTLRDHYVSSKGGQLKLRQNKYKSFNLNKENIVISPTGESDVRMKRAF